MASDAQNTLHETHHLQNLVFPPELILLILQQLEAHYAALLNLSLSFKAFHTEAQPILYRSLHVRVNYANMQPPVVTGPPPKLYVDNPPLAKFIRTIAYFECNGTGPDAVMRKILSASFAHHMPNLKILTLGIERGIPEGFLSSDFQLEELSLNGEDCPNDLEVTLRHQKQLKKLKIMTYQQTLPPFPLSVCPELHTLEADLSVMGAFLPLHNLQTLIWKTGYFDSLDCVVVDHCIANGLKSLKRLCYPLAADLPPLQDLTGYLSSLQYLAIEHSYRMGNCSKREYSILTDLPQDLTAIPNLRGLVLSLSHSYTPSDITSEFMRDLFNKCPRLEFVDVEMHGHYYPRRFVRWVQCSNGKICTKQKGSVAYRKLIDCFQCL